ncbi:MAG: preprotein translocase subunit SecE [Actinobacteria bacterium]|nr:preprotein translocase subunit SecE [Actinomycetota bacterium]
MNRETRRLMQRQGQVDADGSVATKKEPPKQIRNRPPTKQRTTAVQFLREVRGELRQVAWPTRSEVVNSSAVVLITLIFMVGMIFLLDFLFAKGVSYLFRP